MGVHAWYCKIGQPPVAGKAVEPRGGSTTTFLPSQQKKIRIDLKMYIPSLDFIVTTKYTIFTYLLCLMFLICLFHDNLRSI